MNCRCNVIIRLALQDKEFDEEEFEEFWEEHTGGGADTDREGFNKFFDAFEAIFTDSEGEEEGDDNTVATEATEATRGSQGGKNNTRRSSDSSRGGSGRGPDAE